MDKIITENLEIRKFTIDDVYIYFENNNDAEVKKYMPDHSHDNVEKAYDEITGFLKQYLKMKMPYHFAVIKDNILIGHIGIGDSDIGCGIYEICCAINKDNRGLGYATEAIKSFVPWCKHTFGIKKIFASMNQENNASTKTAQNAGFKLANIKHKDKNFIIYEYC
jgi:RimJ/RimL family protein N-acetyltransferase